MSARPRPLDRYTQIGELAESVRHLLQRWLWLLFVVLVFETGFLALTNAPGAAAFAMISTGTLALLYAWRGRGRGLPLVPVLGIQHLVAYGLPIVISHKVTVDYSAAQLRTAGLEVLIFCASLTAAWFFGMNIFRPGPARSLGLRGFNRQGSGK